MARTTRSYGTRPKRAIEQVYGHTLGASVGTGAQAFTLHTAEDRKTLVRAIVNIQFHPIGGASVSADQVTEIAWMAQVEPAGVRITTPQVADILDEPKPMQTLFQGAGGYSSTGTAATDLENAGGRTFERSYDIKGMRKLQEQDEITLVFISDESDTFKVSFDYTLVFKE